MLASASNENCTQGLCPHKPLFFNPSELFTYAHFVLIASSFYKIKKTEVGNRVPSEERRHELEARANYVTLSGKKSVYMLLFLFSFVSLYTYICFYIVSI